jgi:hypothetical protein
MYVYIVTSIDSVVAEMMALRAANSAWYGKGQEMN